jgi:hypothetical protein
MKNFIFKIVLVFVSTFSIFPFQIQEDGLNILKSKKGFLFVFNDSTESFMIEFEGKKFLDIEPEELIFSVDNQIIQFTIVPLSLFLNPKSKLDTLMQHFNFEIKYLKQELRADIPEFEPQTLSLPKARKALFWELSPSRLDTDTSSETVVRHIFATTNTNKFIVFISSPLTKANNPKTAKERIQKALNSFRFQSSRFNLEALRDSLLKK